MWELMAQISSHFLRSVLSDYLIRLLWAVIPWHPELTLLCYTIILPLECEVLRPEMPLNLCTKPSWLAYGTIPGTSKRCTDTHWMYENEGIF